MDVAFLAVSVPLIFATVHRLVLTDFLVLDRLPPRLPHRFSWTFLKVGFVHSDTRESSRKNVRFSALQVGYAVLSVKLSTSLEIYIRT